MQRSFALAQLQEAAHAFADDTHYLPRPSASVLTWLDTTLLAHETSLVDAAALRPALFLCLALLRPLPLAPTAEHTGVVIHVAATARFPIGAGLGSSAAFSVALAGALALACDHDAQAHDSAVLARVDAYAFAAEVILHGAPSGVDNTVATFGGALVFKRTEATATAFTRVTCDLNQFRFLLVNTRVARSTKQQVANVRTLYDADRTGVQRRFDEIDALATAFVAHAQANTLTEAALAHAIERNHTLLNALGVGHAAIERVAALGSRFGVATKLTGAGGGGCTLSLLPRSFSDASLDELTAELEASGFQCYVSAVGGAGFQVEP